MSGWLERFVSQGWNGAGLTPKTLLTPNVVDYRGPHVVRVLRNGIERRFGSRTRRGPTPGGGGLSAHERRVQARLA